MQKHYLKVIDNRFGKEIWEIFGDRVRAILPLLETEIKGAKMLNRTIDYLFVPEK